MGAQAALDGVAWWCRNSGGRTQRGAQKPPNLWGLYDMLGNVWEWTWDLNGPYPASATDPLGAATGTGRIIRGGGWFNSAQYARAAYRGNLLPSVSAHNLGLRLVRTASP